MITTLHTAKAPASPGAPAPSRLTLMSATAPLMLRGPAVAFAPDTETGASAESGPLRIDDAVSLLSAMGDEGPTDEPDGDPEADDGADDGDEDGEDAEDDDTEDEADDQPADGDDAPDDDDPASEDADEDEREATAADPVVDPPTFWSAEEKALFAKAPPEVQKVIAAKDAEYSRQVSLAKEEASEARKDAAIIGEINAAVAKHLDRAASIFQGKWDGMNWAQLAQDDVTSYAVYQEQYKAEQAELQRLQTAYAATAAEEHRQFLKSEGQKLRDAGHLLADPQKGPETKRRLVAYAEAKGYAPTDLQWAGARELDTLFKAMLYDEARAKPLKSAPKPKTAPAKPAPKTAASVRPSTPPPARRETASRRTREVVGRAFASGKMSDAVQALLAMEKG